MLAFCGEGIKQTFDRVGDFRRGAPIANRPRNGSKLPQASADAEVVRIDHLSVGLYFLAFNADISDPVLAATVGAAGDVQFDLLFEAGEPLFQFAREPPRKALRFR